MKFTRSPYVGGREERGSCPSKEQSGSGVFVRIFFKFDQEILAEFVTNGRKSVGVANLPQLSNFTKSLCSLSWTAVNQLQDNVPCDLHVLSTINVEKLPGNGLNHLNIWDALRHLAPFA